MKILLTNNHLAQMGGTETWVLTMARHLAKEHEVAVYTRNPGFVTQLLSAEGIRIDPKPDGYDLALINHNTCVHVGAKRKIFTSHGTVPELERPAPGCDVYVAANSFVAAHHGIDKIILNPIDTVRFSPVKPIGPECRLLAVTDVPMPVPTVGRPSRQADNMPMWMNLADCVISLGRGVLEAMSCGRAVIVWDHRRAYWPPRGDGYLDDPQRVATGFTAGPYAKYSIDWKEEIAQYRPEHGRRNREYILEHHDVRKIAEAYLRL